MKTIPLRDRDRTVCAVAIVDDNDYDALNRFRWHLTGAYAARIDYSGGVRLRIWMHRLIVGLEQGDTRQTDHINGDPLDNRRDNLRIVTQAQNRQNLRSYSGSVSRFRGVSFIAPRAPTHTPKWRAVASVDGVRHHLGVFVSEEEAAACAAAFRAKHMPFAVEKQALAQREVSA